MSEEKAPNGGTAEADEEETGEQDESPDNPDGPQPDTLHVPIDCAVTNLNALDDLAFAERRGEGPPSWQDRRDGHSGDQFLLTLTLSGGGVLPDVTPFNVELRYLVRQQGRQKTTGAFLFNPPAIVTFRAHAPNNGDFIQQAKLQTIRFYAALTQYGDAEVSVSPFYHGQYVGPVAGGAPAPTTFIIRAPTH